MACHQCEPWNFKLTRVGPCMSHLYVGHIVRKFGRHSCVLAHAWGAAYATPRYTDDKITSWCLSWGGQLKHYVQVHQDVLHVLVCMFEVRWRQLLLHYPQRGSLPWGVLETIFRRSFVWENQTGTQLPHVIEGKKTTFQSSCWHVRRAFHPKKTMKKWPGDSRGAGRADRMSGQRSFGPPEGRKF